MPYIAAALILTNLLWFGVILIVMGRKDKAVDLDTLDAITHILTSTITTVASAVSEEVHGKRAEVHGSIPPGVGEGYTIPKMDFSDPNDGLYRERSSAKMIEDDDFAFLHMDPEDSPYA